MSGGAASLEREQTWYASKAGVFLFGGPFEMNLWDSVGVPSAVKRGNRAGCKPRLFAVGAAGQDYRDAAAENEADRLGLCDENELLGKHVAGLEILARSECRHDPRPDR